MLSRALRSLVLIALAPAWSAVAGAPDEVGGLATPDLIIRAAPGVHPVQVNGHLTLRAADDAADDNVLAEALERFDVQAIKPVFEGPFGNPGLAVRIGLDRYYRVLAAPGSDTVALAAELGRNARLIERAELDSVGGVAAAPNDTNFGLQWGMLNTGQIIGGVAGVAGADINIIPGWEMTNGAPELVLAVLDAGMDQHLELAGRLIPGKNVAADPDNDDTSDVCISHGTHVAGIAGANADNAQGVAGVDWSCRIMPVRVLNGCSGLESTVAEGIVWATDHGADVINMSLQFYTGTTVLHDAVLYAHLENMIIVAAAGNQQSEVAYPAKWPETIAVGAIENLGNRWSGSNTGPELDVMAPGANVWSLKRTDLYQYLTGTSMATPHVSGLVCLMKALDPSLLQDDVLQILIDSAIDMGPTPGFDNATGYGRIDALAALEDAQPPPPVPGDLDGDGHVDVNDFLGLLALWGPCAPPCLADLDGNGTVGIIDMLMLLSNWG